jgi:hypothetical protein
MMPKNAVKAATIPIDISIKVPNGGPTRTYKITKTRPEKPIKPAAVADQPASHIVVVLSLVFIFPPYVLLACLK